MTAGPRVLRRRLLLVLFFLSVLGVFLAPLPVATAAEADDTATAMRLADLLRSARTVVSRNQDLINDPAVGDKGLSGEKVLEDALALHQERTGEDPRDSDPQSREGRLLRAQMQSIVEVMSEHQATINAKDVGFKGFIPAVFARLVNERFADKVGEEARVKVTAPERLVRNRKARPDQWEISVIEDEFAQADWPKGEPFSEVTEENGNEAFRILVPEYYTASCLSCHGEPAGEVDITGYPKEGGQEGDLGAAISITLFK
ncbi:Tll0287-like domain-containing protein [Afifella pfennigii]|uniref:Tll0287-like domain-containing protein n=1 Tax=Afifella pfennigii TaxID=209897 RepID=UPI00047C53F6|nr:DUF3365 domain-containing protein [Afifella pfennigii]